MKQSVKNEEYLAKIIHDLKTPAAAQVCALESLLKTTAQKFSQEETDLIELTLNSCNYMKQLIDTYLYVFKLNYQKLILNYEKFNLADLINEIIFELKILLKYNQLKIEISLAEDIELRADKLQIKRVVENILSNSIKNAHKNTTIKISVHKYKNEICFEIKNQGDYIEEKIIKEIFNKYKSYSSIYSRPGVGLGLYLSKEIIHAHFGRMIAQSSCSGINIFGFYLPIK